MKVKPTSYWLFFDAGTVGLFAFAGLCFSQSQFHVTNTVMQVTTGTNSLGATVTNEIHLFRRSYNLGIRDGVKIEYLITGQTNVVAEDDIRSQFEATLRRHSGAINQKSTHTAMVAVSEDSDEPQQTNTLSFYISVDVIERPLLVGEGEHVPQPVVCQNFAQGTAADKQKLRQAILSDLEMLAESLAKDAFPQE
jgi:hypothetical protein